MSSSSSSSDDLAVAVGQARVGMKRKLAEMQPYGESLSFLSLDPVRILDTDQEVFIPCARDSFHYNEIVVLGFPTGSDVALRHVLSRSHDLETISNFNDVPESHQGVTLRLRSMKM